MIQIKRCNYFTGDLWPVCQSVSKIVEILECDGRNYLLITPPRGSTELSTSLKYLLPNQITFNNIGSFGRILENKSNLFGCDLLVFDFFHLSSYKIGEYKKIIDQLNIDHIIAAKLYHYISTDDVNDFHVKHGYIDPDLKKSEIWITDNINKWSVTIDSLLTSYKRDKKIDILFKKDYE